MFALVAVLPVLGTASAASPVARVVSLLGDLKARVVAEGAAEQQMYDRYACWCEETTARKAAAIEEGKAAIEQLSKDILELNGANGVSGASIEKLQRDIAANKESMDQAEALRKKENTEYVRRKAELEDNVRNVQAAISTLAAGTTGFNPAMVETQSMSVAAGVRTALKLYESVAPKNDVSSVQAFVNDPASWVQIKGAPHLQKYTTQSTAIQGMLAEMKDTFERELESNKDEEELREEEYGNLTTTKTNERTLLKASLTAANTKEGDDTKDLADAKVERAETEAQLAADEKFFAEMKQGCKDRADQWAERAHTRTDELGQIAKAVTILEGGAETFETSDATFVQLSAPDWWTRGPKEWAFSALKKAAKHGRVRLALLATEVAQGSRGHFDAVIGEIDAMIKVVRDEERADIEKRDYCQSEESRGNSKAERLSYDMTELTSKIARIDNRLAERASEIAATQQALQDLNNTMAEAAAQRNASRIAWIEADHQDRNATFLIQDAIDTLGEFYAKEALVATNKTVVPKAKVVVKEEPSDSPPDMWTSGYDGRQSEGGGIVSILEMIKMDIQKEMKLAAANETKEQKEFDALRSDAWSSQLAMESKVRELQQATADLNAARAAASDLHLDKEGIHNATTDFLDDLGDECAFMNANFDERATQRKDELAGLENAKNILRGAGYDSSVDEPSASGISLPSKRAVVRPHKESVDEELADLDADEKSFTGFLQRR